MSVRIGLICLGILSLTGCGNAVEEVQSRDMVECALAGAASFSADCTMERHDSDEGRTLILRHPDGGFRRFEIGVPGRGLITADGMEAAQVQQREGMVEVRVGADRYRLPIAE